MNQQRYILKREFDGAWAVIDRETGLPPMINLFIAVGLSVEEATELADHLNRSQS